MADDGNSNIASIVDPFGSTASDATSGQGLIVTWPSSC
jgi:hypothetical protein